MHRRFSLYEDADMILRHRFPALAMLALYLQAAFVLSSVSIIVTDDGAVKIESAAEHLVRWHSSESRSDVRGASLETPVGPCSPGIPGHSHLKTIDSAIGAKLARSKTLTLSSPASPLPFQITSFEPAVSSEAAGSVAPATAPDARFEAAEAAFADLQRLV